MVQMLILRLKFSVQRILIAHFGHLGHSFSRVISCRHIVETMPGKDDDHDDNGDNVDADFTIISPRHSMHKLALSNYLSICPVVIRTHNLNFRLI